LASLFILFFGVFWCSLFSVVCFVLSVAVQVIACRKTRLRDYCKK